MASTVTGTPQAVGIPFPRAAAGLAWSVAFGDFPLCKIQKPLDTQGLRETNPPSFWKTARSSLGRSLQCCPVCEITAPVFPCLGYLWSHVALLPALQMGGTPGYDVRPLERAAETQASFSGNAADPSSLLGRWGCLDEQPQGLWLTALRLLGESWESRNRLEGRPLLGAEGPPSSTSPRA